MKYRSKHGYYTLLFSGTHERHIIKAAGYDEDGGYIFFIKEDGSCLDLIVMQSSVCVITDGDFEDALQGITSAKKPLTFHKK